MLLTELSVIEELQEEEEQEEQGEEEAPVAIPRRRESEQTLHFMEENFSWVLHK